MTGFEPPAAMEKSSETLGGCPSLNLQFHELSYSVPAKKGKMKEVLHDVTGQLLSGRLTAILGPSGAGKTSLLNVLAGFKTSGVRGSVLVNGKKRDLARFRTQSCYISQDLSMLAVLTAEETLTIAAMLKLPSYTDKLGSCIVSDILDILSLTGSRHTEVQNMSGGEQKRLSIGLELISNPPIMFFDEPTSGLDSVSSAQVITHLRSLASAGRAVACVIHQPSSQLCHLFDDVIVLTAGQVLYSGTISQMVSVFEEEGFMYPKDYNRADFALEVACGERGQDLTKLLNRFRSGGQDILDNQPETGNFAATESTVMLPLSVTVIDMDTKPKPLIAITSNNGNNNNHCVYESSVPQYPISQWRQFQVLFGRCMLVSTRELYMTHVRFFSHLFIGILVGIVCYDIGNEASKIFTNSATLFFILMFLFYINSMPTALVFPKERSVLLRELHNNWYSLPSYFFARCVANLPLQLICPGMFLAITYFMTGQPHDTTRVAMSLVACVLLSIVAQTMGMVSGGAFDAELGVFLIPTTSVPMLLFSGYFVRLQDIPYFLRWLGQISYFKLAFEAFMGAVFGSGRSNLKCSQDFCFFKYPPKFVDHLGMREDLYWNDVAGLLGWVIGLHILLYIVLKWRVYLSK